MFKKKSVKSILSALLCISLVVVMTLLITACKVEDPIVLDYVNEGEGFTPVEKFKEISKGDTIYIVPTDSSSRISVLREGRRLQDQELIMLTSLQGILAKDKAQIYMGSEGDEWVEYLKTNYSINFEVITSLEDLFNKVEGSLAAKKFVKFVYGATAVSTSRLNQATTIASATGSLLLPVSSSGDPEGLETFLTGRGFTQEADLIADASNEKDTIEKYKDKLSKDAIAVMDPQMKQSYELRDYVIATGAGVYITEYLDRKEMISVYEQLNPLAITFGNSSYVAEAQDLKPVKGMTLGQWSEEASKPAVIPVVASSVPNLSLYASLSKDVGTQKPTKDNSTSDEVHYVAVLANVGYDISYWDDASTSTKKLADANRGSYPIGYTMNASLYELMPQAVKLAYESMSDNELFVAAPSGFGFGNMKSLLEHKDGTTFDKYLVRTNDLIGKADLGYVSLYGSIEDTDILNKYAAMENLKGGFILAEANKTQSGGIYFNNNKTFVAAREVLRSQNTGTSDLIANDSAEKMAVRLSKYGKDKTTAEGYTLLQLDYTASATSDTSVNSFNTYAKMVTNLFEKAGEDVKFVTPNQLLDLINANVNKEGVLTQEIKSKNIAPKAGNIEITFEAGSTKNKIDLKQKISDENEEDVESLQVSANSRPENGTISRVSSRGVIEYTPQAGFTGTDTFDYQVTDGREQIIAKVTITVK